LITQWGFPCCVRFPCVHAAATTPVQRLGVVFARVTQPCQPSPVPRPDRPHIVLFEVCSAFTRVAACTLARSPYVVTAIRRLQTLRLLHVCSGRFRLERSPGGACTHWKSAALSRRTWKSAIGSGRQNRRIQRVCRYGFLLKRKLAGERMIGTPA